MGSSARFPELAQGLLPEEDGLPPATTFWLTLYSTPNRYVMAQPGRSTDWVCLAWVFGISLSKAAGTQERDQTEKVMDDKVASRSPKARAVSPAHHILWARDSALSLVKASGTCL